MLFLVLVLDDIFLHFKHQELRHTVFLLGFRFFGNQLPRGPCAR